MNETTELTPGLIYRQGDVLLRRVSSLPAVTTTVAREAGRIVLAHGEVTGHAHAIDAPIDEATLLTDSERRRFLHLVRDVDLSHEEHATIRLPAGDYHVVQQRVWTDSAGDEEEQWRYAGD